MGHKEAPPHVTERAAPRQALYWAKRSFGYGTQSLDRGQIFKLQHLENDRRLIDLGYVAPVPTGEPTYACRICNAEFIDPGLRDGHGKGAHEKKRFVPPAAPEREDGESRDSYKNRLDEWALRAGAMSDSAEEQRERIENELAPLDLTKTAASREA